jgi:hypothetical protein
MKQNKMIMEASKGMGRGVGRESRSRNAIHEISVMIVSGAGEGGADGFETHAKAGRREQTCSWWCFRGRTSFKSPVPCAKRLVSKQRSRAAFAWTQCYNMKLSDQCFDVQLRHTTGQ